MTLLQKLTLLITLNLLVACPSVYSLDSADWDFETPFTPQQIHAMEFEQSDGILHGRITNEGGGFVLFPKVNIQGPVRLTLRLKTDESIFGRGEIYWGTKDSPELGMDQFLRFYPEHDNNWHEYKLVIPAKGTVTDIRFMPSWKKGAFALDWFRLETLELPSSVKEDIDQLPDQLELESDALLLTLSPRSHLFQVLDKRTNRTWVADGSHTKGILTKASKKHHSLFLELLDVSSFSTFQCLVTLSDDKVTFELASQYQDRDFYGMNCYPPPLVSDFSDGQLFFCNRSCGVYVDQSDLAFPNKYLNVYGNAGCLDMPWIGLAREETGEGVMLLFETPTDASVLLNTRLDDVMWPQPLWEMSMDKFTCPRHVSWNFFSEGGYVAQAKRYREYARKCRLLVPFAEKLKSNKNIELLRGAPFIWGATDVMKFTREARPLGVLKGVYTNAQHGLRDVDSIRQLNKMGYLCNEYENVNDIHDGEQGPFRDDIKKTAYHIRPGLGPKGGWVEGGRAYSDRSSFYAVQAMKTYIPELLNKYGYVSRYVDVVMAMNLWEDYHPEHTFDRRQDMKYRRNVFDYLKEFDLVLGTEHGNDWGIDLVEYTEGSMSGPYWWEANGANGGWNPGYHQKSVSRNDYPANYLKYAHDYSHRIPLWQLVYHDCSVSTWYGGDVVGFHWRAAPEIADRQDLYNILYGGAPYLWRGNEGYDWYGSEGRRRWLKSYHDVCPLLEEIGFKQLTSHEFLTDDYSLQRTTFDDATTVVVNFSEGPVEYTTVKGTKLVLASNGFHVSGQDIVQERLYLDGDVVTRIEKDDYYRYITPSNRTLGPVTFRGEFVAFGTDQSWNLVTYGEDPFLVDVTALTGWSGNTGYQVVELDDVGRQVRYLPPQKDEGRLVLKSDKNPGLYQLVQDSDQTSGLLIHPPQGDLSGCSMVHLSSTIKDAQIYYTLDDSKPTVDSLLYSSPFRLDGPGRVTLRAQCFAEQQPVGNEQRADYSVYQTLYESGLIDGKTAPKYVKIPLKGINQLSIEVTNANDDCWWDYVNFYEMNFVTKSGDMIPITEMTPSETKAIYDGPYDSEWRDNAPMKVNGEIQSGLGVTSETWLHFDLEDEIQHLEGWIALDDSSQGNGTVKVELKGFIR